MPEPRLPSPVTPRIPIDREAIAAFCRRHGIRRLALFGSVLREDFGPDSDVDVLVEFEPGVRVGLRYFRMQDELAAIIGRPVDLLSPDTIHDAFRPGILQSAQDLYVAA